MILFIIHSFIIFCIVNIIIISLFVERILKLRKNGERLNLKKNSIFLDYSGIEFIIDWSIRL